VAGLRPVLFALGRYLEAIELFAKLHEMISETRAKRDEWLPCGTPLVWISDYYRQLNCPQLTFRYLLLSGISDAIRDKGYVEPNAGFYFRARWYERMSDEEIQKFYADSFAEYEKNGEYKFFPEYILSKVGYRFTSPYPSSVELNIFMINRFYAKKILEKITQRSGSIAGKDVEALAGYLLSCIPGFEIKAGWKQGRRMVCEQVADSGL
jgi:hypothetical protein